MINNFSADIAGIFKKIKYIFGKLPLLIFSVFAL